MLLPHDTVLDELEKMAGLRDLWGRVTDLFRSPEAAQKRRVASHVDKPDWNRFVGFSKSKDFVKTLERSGKADKKTVQHAKSMHDLQHAPIVGKVVSKSDSAKKYEVRQLPGGKLGCTCGDWRYKGSVNPGYECKHIKTLKAGKMKTAEFRDRTAAFFDELSKIDRARKKQNEEGQNRSTGRPFSNLLTQNEEPEDYYPPITEDEPQVIVGN